VKINPANGFSHSADGGYEIVKKRLALAGHGMGGDRKGRGRRLSGGLFADLVQRLDAGKPGHGNIHQQAVKGPGLPSGDGFGAIVAQHRLMAHSVQKLADDQPIGGVVLGYREAQ
jgi:hypothetical protein